MTKAEMIKVYDQRMAGKKGPGRPIYDAIKLLPASDRCPYCDQRDVSTLDHILPKASYPALAVAPLNLVGSCIDCNKAKLDTVPATPEDVVLHPYFEDISAEQWLSARVVHQSPCAVVFRVSPPAAWNDVLVARLKKQFQLLGLAKLYSNQAARETGDIRQNLQQHFDAGGAAAVQTELLRQWRSRRANRVNSWQTATYEALAHDALYYGGGFAN